MNGLRPIALACLTISLSCVAPAAAAGPRIVSIKSNSVPKLDQTLILSVAAQARGDRVQGIRLTLPDLRGVSAVSACRLGTRPGRTETRPQRFAIPYTPTFVGTHLLEIAVTGGGCGPAAATSRRTLALEVTDRDPGAQPPPTPTAGAGRCVAADHLPLRRRLRALRLAIVCLVNAERRARGLHGLHTTRALRRAASRHVRDLRSRRYVGHGAGRRSSLANRLRRVGVRTRRAGENVGAGPARLGSPRSIVAAWMAAGPLRRNVLDPRYRSIGVAAVASVPGVLARSGGTYAAEFSH